MSRNHKKNTKKTPPKPPAVRSTARRRDRWGDALLIVYLLLLVWVIIFKTDFSLPYVRDERAINLIPFDYGDNAGSAPLWDILLNVLIFVPLGIYLSMRRVRWWQAILMGAGLSLIFELTQFTFAIGVTDVTDLMTNTAGSAVGVGVYALLGRMCRKRGRPDRVLKILATVCTGMALLVVLLLLMATLL